VTRRENRNGCKVVVGSVKETEHLEDIDVDGDTIKVELMEGGYDAFTGLMWLRTEKVAGSC
jgi:hypothetical protein